MRVHTSRVIMEEMCSMSLGIGNIISEVLPFCFSAPLICQRT